MSDMDELCAEMERYQANTAKVNRLNKYMMFEALAIANAGITKLHVNFDGCGDSGQIECVGAFAGEKCVEFPAVQVRLHSAAFRTDQITSRDMPLSEAVDELCYGYLEQEYGGWENNDGAFGEFTFGVAERSIAFEFNARLTDYVKSCHTF